MTKIIAKGISGKEYSLEVFPIGTAFNSVPGIYVFIRQNEDSTWKPLYIGQTHDFYNRIYLELKNHDAWECLIKNGATHIAVLRYDGIDSDRIKIETNLRNNYTTPCNGQ